MTSSDPMIELRERFRARASAEATALQEALEQKDATAVERIAHGLAGGAAIFGFSEVGADALSIDSDFAAGRAPNTRKVEQLVESLKRLA